MAVSVKLANMARVLAIVHIIVGFLLICFGIADRVIYFAYSNWTGYMYYGIWIGVWMCITGGLGIPGSTREITRSRNAFAGVFMGFSITSAVFGGIIIIMYSLSIFQFRYYSYYFRNQRNYQSQMAVSICMLLLGITAFVIGIWAPICCCLMKPCSGGCCTCCEAVPQHQGQQVIYTAIPVQVDGGAVSVQASQAQASQPAMVLVPVSGGIGEQSAMVQVGPTTAIPGTVSVPQEAVKPPPYA